MPKRPRGNEWGGGGAHGRRRSRGSGDAEADQGDKVAGTEIHPEVETVLHRLPDGVVRQALSFLAGVWVQNADIVIEFEYYCIMLPFTSCQRPVVLKASTAMLSSFARILCTAAHFCSATAKLTILLTGRVCRTLVCSRKRCRQLLLYVQVGKAILPLCLRVDAGERHRLTEVGPVSTI